MLSGRVPACGSRLEAQAVSGCARKFLIVGAVAGWPPVWARPMEVRGAMLLEA